MTALQVGKKAVRSYRRSLSLVIGTAAVYALWELLAHRFLMFLPMEAWHRVSAGVGTVLALIITAVATRAILHQQHELERLARLKDDLMQMVVHDLRTPLTVMIGSLSTVRAGIVGEVSPGAREMMEMALDGSRTLLGMVNNLLDIARKEAGEPILQVEETDVPVLVEAAVESVAPLARERGLDRMASVQPEIPSLRLDGDKIRRVIINLLGNAVKFSPSGGRVDLRVTWDGAAPRLAISVADTGEGIPPEYRETIFVKFGQVETRQAGRKMSTGLGLTFCKLVAEAHGGSIRVDSAVGQGSTFTVEIPVPGLPASGTAPPQAEPRSGMRWLRML